MKKHLAIIFILTSIILFSIIFIKNPLDGKIFIKNDKDKNNLSVLQEQVDTLQKQILELSLKKEEANDNDLIISTNKLQEDIKDQINREVKSKLALELENSNNKTLSEQVGVSKESFSSCISKTDTNQLRNKINTSVELAMSSLPPEQRGTPFSIVIGQNGSKSEIRGAMPYEEVKRIIDEVINNNVSQKYEGGVISKEDWDHLKGNQNAQIKVIEYSDFDCSYCKIFHETMNRIITDYNGKVSWVYRHWPIQRNSFEKALASECIAKLKGNDAFWKYTELLFGLLNKEQTSIKDIL